MITFEETVQTVINLVREKEKLEEIIKQLSKQLEGYTKEGKHVVVDKK